MVRLLEKRQDVKTSKRQNLVCELARDGLDVWTFGRHARRLLAGLDVLFVAVLLLSSAAYGRDEHLPHQRMLPFPPPGASPLDFTITPGVWLPRVDGEVKLAPGPRLDLRTAFNQGDTDLTFTAELSMRRADFWDLNLSGFHFSTEERGPSPSAFTFGSVTAAAGDPFRSELSMTSVAGEMRVCFFQPLPPPRCPHCGEKTPNFVTEGRRRADLRIAPLFGARYIDVDHIVEAGGMREEVGGEWLAPYVGLHIELTFRPDTLPLTKMIRLEANVSGGPALGGEHGIMWQVRAGLEWLFTDHFGAYIGYRMVDLNVERRDYEFKGSLQGLFLGGTIRF